VFRTLTDGDAVRFSNRAAAARDLRAPRGRIRGLGLRVRWAVAVSDPRSSIAPLPRQRGMVRILNIDARDEGINAFLRARGAAQFIHQREMERLL
jgi:hypothetical protein